MNAIAPQSSVNSTICANFDLCATVLKVIKKVWEAVTDFFITIYEKFFPLNTEVKREIASAAILEGLLDPLTYQSKEQIQARHNNQALFFGGEDSPMGFRQGAAAVPCDRHVGRYIFHLCPGGGYDRLDREQINGIMEIATRSLARQNVHVCCIAGLIGRHPGNTMQHFLDWQADNNV